MCGVAGIFALPTEGPPSLETLRRMIAMLDHRGPDAYGLYRDSRVGLAHARLSIIDLEHGYQPLSNEDGSVWLSFNGEIFNYIELRAELQRKGHRFRTEGDSEVIVHLYEEYGADAWTRLNGQFAFALWDSARGRLALVRDPFGILPMHYARLDRRVVFGSEMKALFASGHVSAALEPRSLLEIFSRWSVAAPSAPFTGVQSVRPGCAMWFDDELGAREQRYWQFAFSEDPSLARATLDEAVDELEERLSAAVALRLRADLPVGAYVSGGLDSAVIASSIRTTDTSSLQTFALRFAESAFDETEFQRRVARQLGTEHHEVVCTGQDIVDNLDSVVWHCEAPLVRTAPVPLFLLSKLVSDTGMRVVLTGEAADELFAGYGIFKEDKIRRFWARVPESEARPRLLTKIHSEVARDTRDTAVWAEFFRKGLSDTDDPYYSHQIRWGNTTWTQRLLSNDVRSAGTADPVEVPPEWMSWPPMDRAQWLEVQTFMSPYLLPLQGDRVAMAHGVEVRYPFLDPGVVDLATRLPPRLRMLALRDKLLLRRLARRSLPPDVARRPKVPYRAPMVTPFVEPVADEATFGILAREECERYGVVDADMVALLGRKARRSSGRISEREQMAFIGALTLQLLARSFGDGFEARAQDARRRLDDWALCVFEDRVPRAGLGTST
jgi:asparagine synthase (glutamine-hydrolysing)